MPIGNSIRALFAPKPPEKQSIPTEEGWSESLLYVGKDWPKYNPDELIGRKGYSVYKRMMTDEQIKAVVKFRRDAITGRRFYFECDHEELSDEDKAFRIGLFEYVVHNLRGSWQDSLNGIMSGMYNGFSLTEKLLGHIDYKGQGWIGVKDLKLRPFDTFYFHCDEYGNVLRITQKLDGKEQEIDASRFIHYVQNPDVDDHYGSSELRECYRAWWSKDIAIKMQNIHLERHASGFIWAQPQPGKTLSSNSVEYTTLQKVLNNVQAKTAIILPSGIDLHVEKPVNTDAYEKAIAQHDKAIAKALLVPNLMGISEQGSTGSFAQSQTQLEAFLWTLDADVHRLEDSLNEQLWRQLGDLNFGDSLYPVMKFAPISDTKKLGLVTLWKDLVSGGAVTKSETDESHIRELLEFPEKAEEEELPGLPALPPPGEEPPEDAMEDDQIDEPEEEIEETVVGKDVLKTSCGHNHEPLVATKAAFSQAMKRVDFAVIGSKSDDATEDAAYNVAYANGQAVKRMLAEAETIGYDVERVTALKYSAAELSAMKKAVMGGLSDGWKIGSTHATKELRKADRSRFSREYFEVTDRALTDIAADYFKSRGHTITGSISNQTQTVIQNTLLEGIKNSRTFEETRKAIYKALESDGLLTEEDIEEALGTVTVKDTKARIGTIMRTSMFEAINEARYQYFSDPELAGFVEALEYAAILDDRTTDICSRLDGKVFALNSEEWQVYNPPNHYGCRSLLIPITVRDAWAPSEAPDVMPQKGFGFDRDQRKMPDWQQGPITFSPIINMPPVNVTVSPGEAPIVNIAPAQVTVNTPSVTTHVAAPNVTVEAIIPESPITFAPKIEVAASKIELPPRKTTTTIDRNGKGEITGTTQYERDI